MEIFKAKVEHLEGVAKLFDEYRVFYEQCSDIDRARLFIGDRFKNNDSTILCAKDENYLGFTQLYPSFSSVSTAKILILNDLYVTASARKKGVARALMNAAKDYAQKYGAMKLCLATAKDNLSAQNLYSDLGYKNDDFINCELKV